MSYNSRYWVDKEARAKVAKAHTEKMAVDYKIEIKTAISKSIIYDDKAVTDTSASTVPTIIVDDIDSVGGILKYASGKTCVLNFSSYKEPGGMFINGSKAQEECLCHESFLYNVLSKLTSFYDFNNQHKNKALYLNRAIYTPDVIFEHNGEKCNCDVLTCAAPNRSAFTKYNTTQKDEDLNLSTLKDRIFFIKKIVEMQNVETLILGAYGCGVFGQDASVVAGLFKEAFLSTNVKTIVYAVPKGSDVKNYDAFNKTFS